mmetsp:Transcript_2404/g.3765  ORF Transcript_2404/g.3765 Transcript_2404/m.3765 type:complete len:219 (+) Transcript_2404:851-1507(+)
MIALIFSPSILSISLSFSSRDASRADKRSVKLDWLFLKSRSSVFSILSLFWRSLMVSALFSVSSSMRSSNSALAKSRSAFSLVISARNLATVLSVLSVLAGDGSDMANDEAVFRGGVTSFFSSWYTISFFSSRWAISFFSSRKPNDVPSSALVTISTASSALGSALDSSGAEETGEEYMDLSFVRSTAETLSTDSSSFLTEPAISRETTPLETDADGT